jgi:thioredoxin-like negative regulator of GroEL
MRPASFVIAVVALVLGAYAAAAMELVMYRRAGCPWCAAWDRDVGPVYGKTEVGRRVPLRLVDIDLDRQPAVQLKSPVRFTPTFALVDDGREVGRIEGYPGQDFFWGLLQNLVPAENAANADGRATTVRRPGDGP